MYARFMTFQARDLPAVTAELDGLSKAAASVAGLVSVHAIWGDDGAGVVTSVYDNADAAEAASAHGMAMWAKVIPYLKQPPQIVGYPNACILK